MAKTVETEVPDWAKWMAKDQDGSWYVYERQPKMHDGGFWHARGKALVAGEGDPCDDDTWKDELYRICE